MTRKGVEEARVRSDGIVGGVAEMKMKYSSKFPSLSLPQTCSPAPCREGGSPHRALVASPRIRRE
jgi:hypothetical protein